MFQHEDGSVRSRPRTPLRISKEASSKPKSRSTKQNPKHPHSKFPNPAAPASVKQGEPQTVLDISFRTGSELFSHQSAAFCAMDGSDGSKRLLTSARGLLYCGRRYSEDMIATRRPSSLDPFTAGGAPGRIGVLTRLAKKSGSTSDWILTGEGAARQLD
jgi:hypothetical protein